MLSETMRYQNSEDTFGDDIYQRLLGISRKSLHKEGILGDDLDIE